MQRHERAGAVRLATRAATGLAALALWAGTTAGSAWAGFEVKSPIVEQGEAEIEFRGLFRQDDKAALDDQRKLKAALGYGVNSFWFTEFEGEWEKEAGEGSHFTATEWENIFQIFPQGEKWLDLGFFAEYEIATREGHADKIEFGPLIQKQFGPTVHTLNLLFEKEIGAHAEDGTEFEYALRSAWRVRRYFEPGIEVFGELGEVSNFDSPSDQEHMIGPVIHGSLPLTAQTALVYDIGYLVGLTPATPTHNVKFGLEYEFRF